MTELVVGLVGVVLVTVGVLMLRRGQARSRASLAVLQGDLAGADIRRIGMAGLVAAEGAPAAPGPGALAITGTHLRFVSGPEHQRMVVPLEQLVSASAEREAVRRGVIRLNRRPLLVVRWRGGAASDRRAVWSVADASAWAGSIAQLIGR